MSGTTQTVKLKEFYQSATKDMELVRPANLFLPDEWTQVFADGIQKLADGQPDFERATVLEVGVGIGVNMAGLLSIPRPPAGFVGLDICNNAISASGALAKREGWDVHLQQSDLLKDVPDQVMDSVSHIVACIPQVPAEINLDEADNYAHYYKPLGTNWDEYGLGLNAELIKQATERAPQASITLNLAGRPGIERLTQLFNEHGRTPVITHEAMIHQHAGTSVASLAAMEHNGHAPFEFFADEEGKKQLTAKEAEALRLKDTPVYHKIYVISAPPLR